MKKIAAISLLALLAFNWVGYRFVSAFFENRADEAFESKINNAEFDEASLIQISVPLNAPYLSGNSKDFERYDGEVELQGVHYRYVKRKVVDGNLVLLCLPNESRNRFQNSRMDFFKLVNDLNRSTQGKDKNSSSVKSFTTEYNQEKNAWQIARVSAATPQHSLAGEAPLTAIYGTVPEQPPRV